jgi:NAD(P)-dependent dehydrogenase (short-subunit alcohol dehydrogenase family)
MAASKFDLSGKAALVTGANSGIGLGFAEGLAEAGADVCIWGRNAEKNQQAAEHLRQYGTRILAMQCDVGDEQQVEACFAETVESLGAVHACFANAGVGVRGTPFVEMTIEEWRDIFRVNMEGAFFTLRTAARHMIDRGEGGSLVVTSSGSAIFGIQRGEHYSATKSGLIGIVRSLAVELARYGIRANAVVPGWIETPMTAGAFGNEKFVQAVLRRVPMRRWGQPSDFSALAVYLASDASAYHTGDSFVIDGGYACF